MTACPARKPTTLEDLDRDELLRFARSRFWGWMERELVWAQWEVATERAQRASKAVTAFYDQLNVSAKAVDDAMRATHEGRASGEFKKWERARRNWAKLRANYLRLQDERDKLEAKVARLDRRADRLYQLHQELP
jgi:hypothetical protein